MILQRWLVAAALLLTSLLLLHTFSTLEAQHVLSSARPESSRRVQAPDPILSISPRPGAGDVWLGSAIRIEFSRPMNRASVESHFSMEPMPAGSFVWTASAGRESVEFQPADILAATTTYHVTLHAGLQDATGQVVLDEDYTWSFTTRPAYDAINFGYGPPVQLVDPDGRNAVEFWPGYPRITINFALYALEPADFTRRYADLEPYNGEPIDIGGLEQVTAWSQTYSGQNTELRTAVIPPDVPSGIYVLTAGHPHAGQDEMFVILSRHVLTVKRGSLDQVVVWASQLHAQTPTPDMTVTLYDDQGSIVAQGTTDADGVVKLNAGAAEPLMAVGGTGGETTVAGMDGAWRSDGRYWYWWWDGWNGFAPDRYRVYLYTDRPIYRPGHMVHYAGILRRDLDGAYTPVEAGTPVTATLRNSRNNVVAAQALTTDEFGMVKGEIELAPEPPLGTYTLELSVAGEAHSHRFQVEAYRKPEYQVEVTSPAPYVVAGDDISVTVQADYFFGQPVAGADVILKVYRQVSYWWYEWQPPDGQQIAELQGTTDADGRWTTTFATDDELGQDAVYTFKAEVTDASRQPVKGGLSVSAYWNTYRLSLSTEKYGYRPDEPIVASLSARGHAGTPVAGEGVSVTLSRTYPEEQIIAQENVITDAEGQATATFTDIPPGWYQLKATAQDDRGRQVEVRRWVWVFDPAYSGWWYRSDDELTISADRETYAPGETAQLLIQSQVTGIALLTLERGTVHEEQIVPITGTVTLVDVPIRDRFAPNIFAQVHIFKPTDDESRSYWESTDEGRLLMAQTELKVPATDRRLTIDITPDAESYRPRDQARFNIRVADADGRPVHARVSLALVDEAIFALAEDQSADIFETFYGRRSNGVVSYDSLSPTRYIGGPEYDEGPPLAPTPTPSPGARTGAPEEVPRREFPDTAYWNPSIEADEDGTATVLVELPDNLTTWRVIVRAVTLDTRVGDATTGILVTQDIIARPALPRFTVLGDEFALDAIGQNYSGQALTGTMSVDALALTLMDEGDQTVDLPDGGSAVARWSAVASEIGDAEVTCRLATPAGGDAIELKLPVHPFAVPQRSAVAGQADPVAVEVFDVPFNAVQDASSVTLRLSPSVALGLLDGLDALINYPYGCVEQTMSRVLPSAVAARAYQDLGIPNPKADELPDIIGQGLQKLYGFQHDDGSWGWWYDDGGGAYMTAYVLFGLTAVEQAGFDVADDVLDRGFSFLTRRLMSTEDPRIEAYALYVMSVAGRGDLEAAQALLKSQEQLDHFSRAALALTLNAEGDPDAAKLLADRLAADAVETPSTAHWPASYNRDQPYHWRTMSSAEKSTAMAVTALVELRPDSQLLPKAVRWLMNHRIGAGWRDTQATAFAVIGLIDYILAAGELQPDYSYVVSLNGEEIAAGSVVSQTATQPIDPIAISGNQLRDGPNTLRIERSGVGRLYYTLALRLELFYDGFEPVSSVDQGLKISRTHRLAEGDRREDGAYSVGDLVEVHLTVEAQDEAWYVIVEDPLPAGFEALNERMNPIGYGDVFAPFRWYEWGYNRKNIYDDRVTFFVTRLWPGRHEFTYLMRAITPGTFSVLPAQAYPMYAEEMWGRSGSQQVSVEPEGLTARPTLAGDFDRNCRVTDFDARQVAGAWGTASRARDVDGDGAVDLWDVAAVTSRRGATCLADQALPGTGNGRVELTVVPGAEAVAVGRAFAVDVYADQADDLGGFSLTLTFDPGQIHTAGVALSPALVDGLALGPRIDNAAGRVAFGVYGPGHVPAGSRLATITFVGRRTGEVDLEIDGVEAVDGEGRSLDAGAAFEGRITLRDQTWLLPLVGR
ncbi:MAG: MG2 domain-containing protein [Anaerolineae bacterium]